MLNKCYGRLFLRVGRVHRSLTKNNPTTQYKIFITLFRKLRRPYTFYLVISYVDLLQMIFLSWAIFTFDFGSSLWALGGFVDSWFVVPTSLTAVLARPLTGEVCGSVPCVDTAGQLSYEAHGHLQSVTGHSLCSLRICNANIY